LSYGKKTYTPSGGGREDIAVPEGRTRQKGIEARAEIEARPDLKIVRKAIKIGDHIQVASWQSG